MVAKNIQSTLKGIRKGAGSPGMTGNLADQIQAQQRQQKMDQFKMQTTLQKLMQKRQKAQLDARKFAHKQSQQKRDQMQQSLQGQASKLAVKARQDPEKVRQILQDKPKLTQALGVDPNSPNLANELMAARARFTGDVPDQQEGQEYSKFVKPNSALGQALGIDRPQEVKYVGGELTPENLQSGKTKTTEFQYEGPQQEAQTPLQGAATAAMEEELKGRRDARTAAVETQQLASDMSGLLVQDDVKTGTIQPAITSLQGFAESAGINLTDFAEGMGIDLGSLSKKEEFNRLAKSLTINQFEKFKGNLNSREVKIAEDSVAQLGTSKKANIKALASLRASARLAEKRANALQQAAMLGNTEAVKEVFQEIQGSGTEEYKTLKNDIEERLRAQADAGGEEQPATQDSGEREVPQFEDIPSQMKEKYGLTEGVWQSMSDEDKKLFTGNE